MKRLMVILILFGLLSFTVAAQEQVIKKTIRVEKKGNFIGLVFIKKASDSTEGLAIKKVIEDSPAEKAGLKDGDRIVKVDGKSVDSPQEVAEAVEEKKVGDTVNIDVLRDGKKKSVTVTVGEYKPGNSAIHWVDDDHGDMDVMTLVDEESEVPEIMVHFETNQKGGFLGVDARDMSDQMKEYFGVKSGVLVEKVLEKTPAQTAGLKAGDVIIQINEKKIADYDDLIRTLNYHDPEETVTVHIVRHKKNQKFKVKLAKKNSGVHKIFKQIKKMKAPLAPGIPMKKEMSHDEFLKNVDEDVEVIIL